MDSGPAANTGQHTTDPEYSRQDTDPLHPMQVRYQAAPRPAPNISGRVV